jgi:UDP-N-acetylmuramoylalanine--D-glutamate ligase
MTDWSTRTVCVTGLGVSGLACVRALREAGAAVVAVDARSGDPVAEAAAQARAAGADVVLGVRDGDGLPPGIDLVVTSPGWRPDDPLLVAALAAGLEVWGEVELAWRLRPETGAAPWLALTGTNGKTTTVRMLEAILLAAGLRAVACGNVGLPVLEAVLARDADGRPAYDVLAVELSSFQLHWTSTVVPEAAALLNLAPDHLDWHGSFDGYVAAKHRVWSRPGTAVAVANADDPRSAELVGRSPAGRTVSTTLGPPAVGQLGVVEDLLVDRAFVDDPVGGARELATLADLPVRGPHNTANALAAAALALAHGVPAMAVRDGLRRFVPDPHRNAHVATVGGVAFVDDSKATNPHAAAASLAAYDSVVWVAGGLAKGADYDELVAGARGRLRGAVLLGRDRARIAAALSRHAPEVPVVEVGPSDTDGVTPAPPPMAQVVAAGRALARPGDVVLLAPAAASMDMFRDYGARGDAFAAAVRELAAAAAEPAGPVGR